MLVKEITSRKINTRFGEKPVYTVVTDHGPFEAGFKKPTFKAGDNVEFTFTEDKYGKKIDDGSVRVIDSAAGAPAPIRETKGDKFTPKTFPIPLLHGDRAVVRQNSLRHAATIYAALLSREATVAGLSLAEMAEATVSMARVFEEYSCGDAERRAAEGEAE